MEISFDFSEVYNLGSALTRAGQTARQQAELVVAKSAHDLEAQAKSLAPVDTGALMNSIGTDATGLHAEVGPTVNYAQFLEFGTYKMAPQPFMGPAADAVEPAFLAAMEQIAAGVL